MAEPTLLQQARKLLSLSHGHDLTGADQIERVGYLGGAVGMILQHLEAQTAAFGRAAERARQIREAAEVEATPPIAEDDLTALEQLCAAATPGPWEADGGNVWRLPPGAKRYESVCEVDSGALTAPPDAVFIAAAREHMPKLIAEVRRLRMFKRFDDEMLGDIKFTRFGGSK